MMAALLAAAAFLVTDRKKWGFLAGIVFLGTSLGIYQAYLSFAIILCILRLLLDILDRDNIQEIIIKAITIITQVPPDGVHLAAGSILLLSSSELIAI